MTMTVGHLRDIVNDLGIQSPLLDEIGERLATYNDHWRYVSTTVLRNNLCNLGLTLRLPSASVLLFVLPFAYMRMRLCGLCWGFEGLEWVGHLIVILHHL